MFHDTLKVKYLVSGIKSAEAVLSKTDEHESGSVCYVGCFMYCGSWERKWVNGAKMLMLYHVWK